MNFQSEFFKTLRDKNWWWVVDPFKKNNCKAIKQKYEFDNIAHAIETSSCCNKIILHKKLQKIIDHIDPSREGRVISSKLQEMSLDEFCEQHPDAENNLEHSYAEWTNYVSIFSEMKVFDELRAMGLREIQFLEEVSGRKTPDLKAIEHGEDIFVEVKFISPPKNEEQGMIARVVDFVEVNENFWESVKKKLFDGLEDAKDKFEAMGAYADNCKRWVYIYIFWGTDANVQYSDPESLINDSLISEIENKFGIEPKFFKTF